MKKSNKSFCVLLVRITEFSFPDDVKGDGFRNVGLLAVQPTDAAAGPRKFYSIQPNERFTFNDNQESVNIANC
jgi:hypothetical protein